MERLFRDRMEYIDSAEDEGCFICRALEEDSDEENLVLDRGEATVVILNRYPYNTGHSIVAPRRHVGELTDLDEAERVEVMASAGKCIEVMRRRMRAEGFNLGANIGRVAGAGLPDHFHLHVVPRWAGDTNFMPVTGDSKVLPEHLADTYRRLREGFTGSR